MRMTQSVGSCSLPAFARLLGLLGRKMGKKMISRRELRRLVVSSYPEQQASRSFFKVRFTRVVLLALHHRVIDYIYPILLNATAKLWGFEP